MLTKLLLAFLIPQLTLMPVSPQVKGVVTIKESPGWQKISRYNIEPIISAPSAVVIDAETGRILFKKNHTDPRPIASITKLMTVYAYLKKTDYDLDRQITMLKTDERNGGQRNIYRGEIGSARDFLNIALIASDNSAAAALARAGGFLDDFEKVSAQIAQEIDLKNTDLKEPTGLNPSNTSTALDIARLGQAVFNQIDISEIARHAQYIFSPLNSKRKRIIKSTNDLLGTSLFKIIAAKTGYTKDAGYCLVLKAAPVDSNSGKKIIIAILGAPSSKDRFQDAKALAWWVFENFE